MLSVMIIFSAHSSRLVSNQT